MDISYFLPDGRMLVVKDARAVPALHEQVGMPDGQYRVSLVQKVLVPLLDQGEAQEHLVVLLAPLEESTPAPIGVTISRLFEAGNPRVAIRAQQYTEYGKLVAGMCNSQSCYTSGNDQPHVHLADGTLELLAVNDWVIQEPDGSHRISREVHEVRYEG
jgi:hypothetical protein